MIEKPLFSFKEVAEFIMAFYNFSGGCWEFDLRQIPSIRKFIGLGFAEKSKECDNLYVLSELGKMELNKYIQDISELFIDYMQIHNYEQPLEDVVLWFKDKLQLETVEDGREISEYICNHLHNYGYAAKKISSTTKGKRYFLERVD